MAIGLKLTVEPTRRGQKFTNSDDLIARVVSDFQVDFDLMSGRVSEMLLTTLEDIFKQLQAVHGSPWPLNTSTFGTSPQKQLALRSGKGLDSIKQSITVRTGPSPSGGGFAVEGSISTGLLTVHETGVTITAKNAKYLTIPLRAALDSRGLPLRARARDWDNTFIRQAKRGGLYIFQKQGRNVVPLYMLKSSVYIPPRLQMRETFNQYADIFGGQLEREFQAQLGGK